MDFTKLLYVAEGLPLILLFALSGVIARTVLPGKLLDAVQKRRWTYTELAIVVAPGVMAAILGLLFLEGAFWPAAGGLSAVMVASAMAVWGLGRRWPRLSLSQKSARVFLLYLVVALGATLPALAGSGIRWTHLRGVLALGVLLLFVALLSAGALLVIGGATVYFAVASEIARSLLLSPSDMPAEPEQTEAPGGPEPLPPQAEFSVDGGDTEVQRRMVQ